MRGELETEQNCNILTPTLMAITAFLSRSPGLLNQGPGGPASLGHGPHSSIFSLVDSNFLCTELYYCFMPTQSLPITGQWNMQLPPSLEWHVWPGRRSIYNILPVSLNWTSVSPLLNSCPKQKTVAKAKQRTHRRWPTIILLMSFSACLHLHVRLHSLWFYVIASVKIHDHLLYKLTQGSHVFSNPKNISCMRSICADICAEVSGNFSLHF